MRFKILIQTIATLTLFSCNEKQSTKTANIEAVTVDTISQAKFSKKVDFCLGCAENFKNFPKDSITFEQLYGYPDGARQEQAYDDVQLVFKCVHDCFDKENLINLIKLSAIIRYDADGPSYLQSNLHQYIKNNKDLVKELYYEIDCTIFRNHLKFLFEGLENSKYIEELNGIFNSLHLKDSCKSKSIMGIPKMISHEH